MNKIALIAIPLIALASAAGCSGQNDQKAREESSTAPISATSSATKAGSSTASPDESPTTAADENVASASTTAADGETPKESADTDSESPDETADKPDSTEPPAPKVEGAVSAVTLAREFEKDETAAETKYKDMTILVEGKVGMYLAKTGYIYLTGSKEVRNVICILKSPTSEEIKYGDTVAVKGRFDLVAVLGISMKECELVKVNP